MNMNQAMRGATAVTFALVLSTSYATGDTKTTTEGQTMTGKEKATAIGATTGAVAGAVVGGPVGAVVGAGVGAYVGNKGTNADGKVASNTTRNSTTQSARNGSVRNAQEALNAQGYNLNVDGQWGPNTQDAVRRFQADKGIAQTGTLDGTTLDALGVNR